MLGLEEKAVWHLGQSNAVWWKELLAGQRLQFTFERTRAIIFVRIPSLQNMQHYADDEQAGLLKQMLLSSPICPPGVLTKPQ